MRDRPAPFFSILIPAYNRPDFLVAAVRSVLANGFGDFEILVSEDHSPGQKAVMARLEEFAGEPRVRGYAQPRNLGWSGNRNFLVAQARGRFVWLMGDDDLLPCHALGQLHAFISRRPDHSIYACGYEVIDEHDRHRYVRQAAREVFLHRDDAFAFRELLLSHAVPFWIFHPFTYAYRRELGAAFPYRATAHIGDDLFFLYEAFLHGHSIAISPEIWFRWRKFTPVAAQANLSSAINGIRARAAILDLFAASPVWQTEINRRFPRRDFTRRYLHAALEADSSGQRDDLIAAVRQDPKLAAHFAGWNFRPRPLRRLQIRAGMLTAYLRLNGPAGIDLLAGRAWRTGCARLGIAPPFTHAS